MTKNAVLLIAAVALLGACSDNPDSAAGAGEGSASGDVLQGSISDDMLPLDTVKSQSPPAAPVAVEGESEDDEAGDPAAEETPGGEPEITPEPAAEGDSE